MSERTIPETLRAAAARVRQGWCRFLRDDDSGNVCAMGALDVALGNQAWACRADRTGLPQIIAEALRLPTMPGVTVSNRDGAVITVVHWNNGKDQTAENVAAGFEYAALVYEQQQAIDVDGGSVAQPVTVRTE